MSGEPASQRVILSIDTSDKDEADKLAKIAKDAGAKFVKLGLELSSASSWNFCSELAATHQLEWIADAKLSDIPNTVSATIKNLKSLKRPPFAITIHATAGSQTMKAAQTTAGEIKMLGVTILTSIDDEEGERIFHAPIKQKVMELARDAAEAGLAGIVASPLEVGGIKNNPETKYLLTMIPGTRSAGAEKDDQARVTTPAEAIRAGADLLVIGRQITQAKDPASAYNDLIAEIEKTLGGASAA